MSIVEGYGIPTHVTVFKYLYNQQGFRRFPVKSNITTKGIDLTSGEVSMAGGPLTIPEESP
jgi:hypothetical protein